MENGDNSVQSVGQLLFVNKDASNVASRSTKEAYSINSHVQRQRKERSKPSYSRESPESTGSHAETQPKANEVGGSRHRWRINQNSVPISSCRRSDTPRDPNSPDAPRDHIPCGSSASRQLAPRAYTIPFTVIDAKEQTVRVPSPPYPVTILNKGNSDPFSAAALPISPKANETLQHARRVGGFMIWPAESVLQQQSPIIKAWWETVHSLIEDVGSFQSFLSYATALKALVHEADRPTLIAQALAYKAQSIGTLRWRMTTQPADLKTLSMIVHLFGAEFYSKDLVAAMTHLKAAKQITEELGGLSNLPQVHREIILTSDVVIASICLSRPLFDVEEWDPGLVEDGAKRMPVPDRAINRLTAALSLCRQQEEPLDHSISDPDLETMFVALRELFDVEEYKTKVTSVFGSIDDKIFRWLHLRKLACRSRLLQYYIDTAKPVNMFEAPTPAQRRDSTTDENCLDACLCVAAIYAESIVFSNVQLPSAHARFFGLLRRAYLVCLQKLGQQNMIMNGYGNAMLWILAMGAIDEEKHKGKEPRRIWHSAVFARCAWDMGLTTFEDIKERLRTFVYSERAQDRALKSLVDNLEDLASEAEFMEMW